MNNDAKSVQDALKKFLDKTKAKHFQSDRNDMVKEISNQVMNSFTPVLKSLAENSRISKEELASVIREIKIVAPEVKMPEIHIPEPKVTVNYTPPPVNVNVPKQEQQKFPDSMKVTGDMSMSGIDRKSPLPVMMMDQAGKPMQFNQGAGGGKGDFFTIKDIQNSTGGSIIDNDGFVKVTGNFTVSSSATSTIAQLQNSDGLNYNSDNPLPVTFSAASVQPVSQVSGQAWSTSVLTMPAVVVTSITNSTASAIVDSTGVQYSGSNPIPITVVSGALTSTVVVGDMVARGVDNGGNPVKIGGIARKTNPTAYNDGERANMGLDSLGRMITRPVQVRGLVATAYASIANGTETTLLAAGGAGVFHDLIYVMGTNNSDIAVSVDIRSVTAGNIETTLRIPANGTTGVSLPVPIPQGNANNNWTADLPDVTGTTVTLSGLFSKEI